MSDQTVQSIIAALRKEAERNPEKTLWQLDTISNTYLTHDSDQIRVDAIRILDATAREYPSEVLPIIDKIIQRLQDNNEQVRRAAEAIIKSISEAPPESIGDEEVPDQLLTGLDIESLDQEVRNRITNRIVSILLKSTNSRHSGVKISEDEIRQLERLAREESTDSNTELNTQKISELISEIKTQQNETTTMSDSPVPHQREPLPNEADPPIPDLESVASPPPRSVSYNEWEKIAHINTGGQVTVNKVRLQDGHPEIVAIREPLTGGGTVNKELIGPFVSKSKRWKTVAERERTKREWRDRDHIVSVVDYGETKPWIAVEYMDGGDGADLLDAYPGGLPLAQALWIGECICKALEISHDLGTSHLDIKPKNVLFKSTPEGMWPWPKLSDWGLARNIADETGSMERLSGEYAAPEQYASGTFGDPTQRTDIYQTAATVYAFLIGHSPVSDGNSKITRYEAQQRVTSEERPPPPSDHRDDIPPAIDAALEIGLERDKRDRYDSISEFKQALRQIRTGEQLPLRISDRIGR